MLRRLSHAPVTGALMAIIAVVAVLEWQGNAFDDLDVLASMGGIVAGLFEHRQYWRLLAAMFLHASWVHWFVNTFSLYQLGTLFEQMFGSTRFVIIYVTTGIIASAASAMRVPPEGVAVGASGAILGILGAFIFSLRRSPRWRHHPQARLLLPQLVFWALLNIALGFQVPGIDNAAHLGGLLSGLLLGLLLPHREPPPPPRDQVLDITPGPG